jgi:hypothetical protein
MGDERWGGATGRRLLPAEVLQGQLLCVCRWLRRRPLSRSQAPPPLTAAAGQAAPLSRSPPRPPRHCALPSATCPAGSWRTAYLAAARAAPLCRTHPAAPRPAPPKQAPPSRGRPPGPARPFQQRSSSGGPAAPSACARGAGGAARAWAAGARARGGRPRAAGARAAPAAAAGPPAGTPSPPAAPHQVSRPQRPSDARPRPRLRTSRSPKSVTGSPRPRSISRTLASSVGTSVARILRRSSNSARSFSCSSRSRRADCGRRGRQGWALRAQGGDGSGGNSACCAAAHCPPAADHGAPRATSGV